MYDQQNEKNIYLTTQNDSLSKLELEHKNEIIQNNRDYKKLEKENNKIKNDLEIEQKARGGAMKKIVYFFINLYI